MAPTEESTHPCSYPVPLDPPPALVFLREAPPALALCTIQGADRRIYFPALDPRPTRTGLPRMHGGTHPPHWPPSSRGRLLPIAIRWMMCPGRPSATSSRYLSSQITRMPSPRRQHLLYQGSLASCTLHPVRVRTSHRRPPQHCRRFADLNPHHRLAEGSCRAARKEPAPRRLDPSPPASAPGAAVEHGRGDPSVGATDPARDGSRRRLPQENNAPANSETPARHSPVQSAQADFANFQRRIHSLRLGDSGTAPHRVIRRTSSSPAGSHRGRWGSFAISFTR